jgi:hypothetical protein
MSEETRQCQKPGGDTLGAIYSTIGHVIVLFEKIVTTEIMRYSVPGRANEIIVPTIPMQSGR